ncbi:hypothetical protein [Nocardia sp. NPDC049149]|uniref:hypothetical protein n=1 Tax=Nocardia sp. NPDC049149 TaxID=3364315 RepID=UPI003712DCA7
MNTDVGDFDDPVTSWLDRLEATTGDDGHPPLLQYDDGTWSVVDDDGWPSDPVALDMSMLQNVTRPALPAAAIDIEPESVADIETPGEGPPPGR